MQLFKSCLFPLSSFLSLSIPQDDGVKRRGRREGKERERGMEMLEKDEET